MWAGVQLDKLYFLLDVHSEGCLARLQLLPDVLALHDF
jgi:hypothetical protein